MAQRVPAEVFPPGEFLRDELEARGWTQGEFAEIIGRPIRLVNEIIAGKRGITPATAKELGAALGTSAEFWMNLDAAFQLAQAAPPHRRISHEARLRARFPVREMTRRGWIAPSPNPEVLEARVLKYFAINALDEEPQLAHAAKQRAYGEPLTPAHEAWLFRVKQLAETLQVGSYSARALRLALPRLHALTAEPEEIRHVPRVLAECGVRLVVVEPLPGMKVDGVCFWLGATPVIGLTLRFDRIDNFWFVLRHELEHVLRGDAKTTPIIDSDLAVPDEAPPAAELPPEEVAANAAASEFCVPAAELTDFVARLHPLFSEHRVVLFAKRIGVHPGLVVGQLQRHLNRYDLLRKLLVKVRHLVTQSALTDGYGQLGPVTL